MSILWSAIVSSIAYNLCMTRDIAAIAYDWLSLYFVEEVLSFVYLLQQIPKWQHHFTSLCYPRKRIFDIKVPSFGHCAISLFSTFFGIVFIELRGIGLKFAFIINEPFSCWFECILVKRNISKWKPLYFPN